MMETREMDRLYMKAANNAAGIIAGHNFKSLQMSRASALSSFEYMARLAGAKTGLEVIKSSGAHYRNQLDVLRGYTDDLVDLALRSEICGRTVQNAKGRSKLRCPLPNMQIAYAIIGSRYGRSICLQSSSRGETMRVLNDWPIMP